MRIVAMARVALTNAQRFFPLSESTYGPAQKYRTVVCHFRVTDAHHEEGLQAANGEMELNPFSGSVSGMVRKTTLSENLVHFLTHMLAA